MAENDSKSATFFSLYNTVQGRLYTYILMLVHNRTAAEDIMQETASIMWDQFDQFQEGTNFGAWAFRIARNKSLEFLRENKKSRIVLQENFYHQIAGEAEKSLDDFSFRLQALELCSRKLNSDDRKLLRMRYQKSMPIKDIAQTMGLSSSAMYKKLVRIMGILRICISKTLPQLEQ